MPTKQKYILERLHCITPIHEALFKDTSRIQLFEVFSKDFGDRPIFAAAYSGEGFPQSGLRIWFCRGIDLRLALGERVKEKQLENLDPECLK